jgi:serine O-acetyltransferase
MVATVAQKNPVLVPAPSAVPAFDLSAVVDALASAGGRLARSSSKLPCGEPLPSRDVVIGITEALRTVIFPGYFGLAELTSENLRYHLGHTLDGVQRSLQVQVKRGLAFLCDSLECQVECDVRARSITERFLARLPAIQRLAASDVRAAFEGDPAASTPEETIFCYPGILAITSHRFAHELYRLGVPLLARMIGEHAHSSTGIDIHPGAEIGERFFIDHGTGVVIGETCVIGSNVRLYQGVTLGAKSFPLDADGNPIKGIPRHPIIEDDVIIYAGATILGRVTIGKGSVIGGNVWLTRGCPPGSRVNQQTPTDPCLGGSGI